MKVEGKLLDEMRLHKSPLSDYPKNANLSLPVDTST
jgi:hypothetical protein